MRDLPHTLAWSQGAGLAYFLPFRYTLATYFCGIKYMNKEFLEEIKKQLQTRERELMTELENLTGQPEARGEFSLQPPDYGTDEDDNSAEVAAFTTDLSVKEVLEASLRDIRGALDRIAKNNYGLCRYCGQPIDERRLRARPASSSCVNCKENLKSQM